MKKILWNVLSLLLMVMVFVSCECQGASYAKRLEQESSELQRKIETVLEALDLKEKASVFVLSHDFQRNSAVIAEHRKVCGFQDGGDMKTEHEANSNIRYYNQYTANYWTKNKNLMILIFLQL